MDPGTVRLVSEIIKLAGFMHKKWRESSSEIRQFHLQATRLKQSWQLFEDIVMREGAHTNKHVKSRLDTVRDLQPGLNQQIAILKKQRRWSSIAKNIIFLTEANLLITKLIVAIEDIPGCVADENKFRENLRKNQASEILPLHFLEDKRYVPLVEAVDKVKKALKEQDSKHRIVTLHGQFGSGKTALAQYLALLCYNESVTTPVPSTSAQEPGTSPQHAKSEALLAMSKTAPPSKRTKVTFKKKLATGFACFHLGNRSRSRRAEPATSTPVASSTAPQVNTTPEALGTTAPEATLPFESSVEASPTAPQVNTTPEALGTTAPEATLPFENSVVFLTCGPHAHSEKLWVELCTKLGHSELVPLAQDEASSSTQVQVSSKTPLLLKSQLIQKLQNRQILIILDDVWQDTLVDELCISAKGVKYLVTSHIEQIWSTAYPILLANPKPTEATEIFNNHLQVEPLPAVSGSTIEIITKHFKLNPWKIARTALAISQECIDIRPYVNDGEGRILNRLNSLEKYTNAPTPEIYGACYSKTTLRNACSYVVKSYRTQNNTLILACLVAIFGRATGAPKALFEEFFSFASSHEGDFGNSSIPVIRNRVITVDKEKRTWSTDNDYQAEFLKETDTVDAIVSKILKSEEELSRVLCILYGKKGGRLKISDLVKLSTSEIKCSVAGLVFLLLHVLNWKDPQWNDQSDPCIEMIAHCVKDQTIDPGCMRRLLESNPSLVKEMSCERQQKMATSLSIKEEYPRRISESLYLYLVNLDHKLRCRLNGQIPSEGHAGASTSKCKALLVLS